MNKAVWMDVKAVQKKKACTGVPGSYIEPEDDVRIYALLHMGQDGDKPIDAHQIYPLGILP